MECCKLSHHSTAPSLHHSNSPHEIPSPHLEQFEAAKAADPIDAPVHRGRLCPIRFIVVYQTGVDRRRDHGRRETSGGHTQGLDYSVVACEL